MSTKELRIDIERLAASYGMMAPVIASLKGGSLYLSNDPKKLDTAKAMKGKRKIPR